MPYDIKPTDGKYSVVNRESGSVKSKGTTKAKAVRQERLLRAVEHGFKPTGQVAKRVDSKHNPHGHPGGIHRENTYCANPHLAEYLYDNARRM